MEGTWLFLWSDALPTTRTNVDEILTKKENWPELVALTSIFFVELPGIEPGAETALTCEDDGIEYEKMIFPWAASGRALGLGELKLAGQVLPNVRKGVYNIDIKRVMRSKLVLGIADGWLSMDGEIIYRAKDLKVGLFKQEAAAPAGA